MHEDGPGEERGEGNEGEHGRSSFGGGSFGGGIVHRCAGRRTHVPQVAMSGEESGEEARAVRHGLGDGVAERGSEWDSGQRKNFSSDSHDYLGVDSTVRALLGWTGAVAIRTRSIQEATCIYVQ